ncbi:DUF1513 domain-containing protein [Litoribrevibacter euphylliae]|uniref:DUF1513 domain-containing protein n=1 Tax=Litoribrevibacter euphylliae TaxID=1834034 RepID=A0ABV7HAI8_9GAMM
MNDRRAFIKLLAAMACTPALVNASYTMPERSFQKGPKHTNLLISAFDDHQGQHYIGAYGLDEQEWLQRVRVSRRYHSAVSRKLNGSDDSLSNNQLIFVARRPGDQAIVLDLVNHQVIEVQAPAGRHFYGHAGVDARNWVWFTENDFKSGRSLLVARSGSALEKIEAEIDLQGIGPHEFRFLADGRTAVIGLGGIETHPDFPRKKLNLDSMQSEILLVDTVTGKVIDRDTPLDPQLSLRHLDVSPSGDVVIAAQYQGPKYEQFPLVYRYSKQAGLNALKAPESVWRSMNQYIASVQINWSFQQVLVTCPRANAIHLFSLETGDWLSQYRIGDPGGASLDEKNRFLVSTGQGAIVCLSSKNGVLTLEREQQVGDTRWDNHMDRVVIG